MMKLGQGAAAPADEKVTFSTVAKGFHSGILLPRRLVIRERGEWEKLWLEHASIFIPPPPLPPVDFSREMVVALYSGEKPTGGFSVEIREVVRTEGNLVVRYVEQSPSPGAVRSSVLTQPFHIIRLDRAPGSVDFELISGTK